MFSASMDQQVSLISPAVARKLAQSGFTLTQVYHQYVATAEELELTKTECVQLRDNMDTIIKQVIIVLGYYLYRMHLVRQ
jgi:hypothetical protein